MIFLKNKKIIFIILIAVFFVILFATSSSAESFTLNKTEVDVSLNGTAFISASGGSGTTTWSSSDTSIATVENGTVRGLKIGTTTITATRGQESASCTVNVVYTNLRIGGNGGDSVSSVNLFLGVHETETLTAEVEDGNFEEVSGALVNWSSSDSSIVTVESTTGKLQAIKTGTATITASAAGVTDTCEVTVLDVPNVPDFSNAKYNISFNGSFSRLQITNIEFNNENSTFYYIITPNDTTPEIKYASSGFIDTESMGDNIQSFSLNMDENYMYTRDISKYLELNQDLYLWVVAETRLGDSYYNETGASIRYENSILVNGEKLTRPALPQLNLILQTFSIGSLDSLDDSYTSIRFNFPSDTANRKFTLKIGKVTNTSILTKIQNNDYSGITDLLAYAKSAQSIYSQELTTTDVTYFRSDSVLFDGNKLLEDDAYYYIYVEFDDEDGKYYPIEGVTLGQAWISSVNDSWNLWAYTSSNFEWGNLTPSGNNQTVNDPTVSNNPLPATGANIILVGLISVLIISGIIFFIKYNKLKGIK